MNRFAILAVAFAAVVACDQGTAPIQYGPLKADIIEGEAQAITAGEATADPVIGFAYREPLTTARAPQTLERTLEDLFLPSKLYAQSASVNVQAQPNAVYCLAQPSELVAFVQCVNTDALGRSRFDFLQLPTRAGTYRARFRASYGLDTTTFDSATIVVNPAAPDPNRSLPNFSPASSPALLVDDAVVDIYENRIPYRIVGDQYLTVQGATPGSVEARTVTFTAAGAGTGNHVTELRGADNALVGRLQYRITLSGSTPAVSFSVYGTGITPP